MRLSKHGKSPLFLIIEVSLLYPHGTTASYETKPLVKDSTLAINQSGKNTVCNLQYGL